MPRLDIQRSAAPHPEASMPFGCIPHGHSFYGRLGSVTCRCRHPAAFAPRDGTQPVRAVARTVRTRHAPFTFSFRRQDGRPRSSMRHGRLGAVCSQQTAPSGAAVGRWRQLEARRRLSHKLLTERRGLGLVAPKQVDVPQGARRRAALRVRGLRRAVLLLARRSRGAHVVEVCSETRLEPRSLCVRRRSSRAPAKGGTERSELTGMPRAR